jgi:adenine deaminase
MTQTISGRIIDIPNRRTYSGTIVVVDGLILSITEDQNTNPQYLLPGFVDAHVHIESSMLVPSEFARLAVVHGTVATVSDPHEIGNVLGVDGVLYMIENGRQVNFKFNFGAPSCVPATSFETAGAEITAGQIDELLHMPEIRYLSEMMNWPGVLFHDPVVHEKIAISKKHGKPIDGHAPGLRGERARDYIAAGMSTDHECFTLPEALDKLKYGMKIAIREGSAAKNFEALYPILKDYPDMVMLCSDDKHPDNLLEGHINELVRRAMEKGVDMYHVLQAACINPVRHYRLDVGMLRAGDPADFIVVDDLKTWKVKATYINGEKVAENGKTFIPRVENKIVNQFNCKPVHATDFQIKKEAARVHVIEALDGQLITNDLLMDCPEKDGWAVSSTEADILKFSVINRYRPAKPALAFIKNFGLKRGAIASTVGHDSHNILVVGVDDESMACAVNLLVAARGGVSAVDGDREMLVPLPVAGLMSERDGYEVAEAYSAIDRMSKEMGSTLQSPFMSLSFMALLVIPALKLSDLGLFDGEKFEFKKLFEA